MRLLITSLVVSANLVGAGVVVVLVMVVLPGPPPGADVLLAAAIGIPAYIGAGLVIGTAICIRHSMRVTRWIQEDRRPTPREQRQTLRLPLYTAVIEAVQWGLAAAVFTTLFGILQPDTISRVLFTTILGGLATCADTYLVTEFALRPVAALAMAGEPPRRPLAAGVLSRSIVFWLLGTGVPVAGLMITALFTLAERDVTPTRLAITMLVLGACTLVFGGGITLLTAKGVVAPVRSVRRALEAIRGGDLSVEVPVFDGTELGSLQAGFNRMAAGLRERERIRDLFGRYVGTDVAADAVARGVGIGGEERFAAVLFVDLVGSTELAATRKPTEVVALLNRFLQIVIDETDRNGGLINKFAGDAALAVFGAPGRLDDPAGAALATARAIAGRLQTEEIVAGIGVAAGTVVAGTIGDERRYEYTVIGDPVNEAARLTELSKSYDDRLLASMTAVTAARSDAEQARWTTGDEVVLRGRTTPTSLAVPAVTAESIGPKVG